MLTKELLEILCCPACKSDLVLDQKRSVLVCTRCGRTYAIRENIPRLLPDNDKRPSQ